MKNIKTNIIDDIINLYAKGMISCEESTTKAIQEINNYTWEIDDIDCRIHTQNILYKRFFSKMYRAILHMEHMNN